MSRPPVSVVMPFAGDPVAAREAVAALLELETMPGDELILADNAGIVAPQRAIQVVTASGERSPAHARNAGAERAHGDWILFLDADCRFPPGLLDAFFAQPVAEDVGALAGEVVPAGDGATVAERYGAARSFLSQKAHLAHPYLPRAVAANLLVRRAAFEQVGGFYEGVRAAEDTDFSWRLQRAGWRLELRPEAKVEHRYRASLRELRAQWRAYAAGRAWLRRRYQGFEPEPAVRRGLARACRRVRRDGGGPARPARPARRSVSDAPSLADARPGRLDRAQYFALDALLAVEELAGFTLSNRPEAEIPRRRSSTDQVVLVADRFPAPGDPLVDFARTLDGARVEAGGRPESPWVEVSRELEIAYREDDGLASRAVAVLRLGVRHPLRCGLDVVRRGPGEPALAALAPAAVRLVRQRGARVHPLGGEEVKATAQRLAALAGRGLAEPRRP
jgi:Glycosyl transferase family group 2